MVPEFLYGQSELLIAIALLIILVLAAELGYRVGRRVRAAPTETGRAQGTTIQAALLALFALLLGFTFAMALSRFDLRKLMVVRESNAIGTAALRARCLPAPRRAAANELFCRYVDVRLNVARSANLDTPALKELAAEARRLQGLLWQEAAAAAEADPRSVPAGLFVQAMNDVIDIKGEGDIALANHVPESVLLLLFGFAFLAVGMVAYGNGIVGSRAHVPTAVLCVVIVLVILLIIDLDRPQRGVARVSQTSLVDLVDILDAPMR